MYVFCATREKQVVEELVWNVWNVRVVGSEGGEECIRQSIADECLACLRGQLSNV